MFVFLLQIYTHLDSTLWIFNAFIGNYSAKNLQNIQNAKYCIKQFSIEQFFIKTFDNLHKNSQSSNNNYFLIQIDSTNKKMIFNIHPTNFLLTLLSNKKLHKFP